MNIFSIFGNIQNWPGLRSGQGQTYVKFYINLFVLSREKKTGENRIALNLFDTKLLTKNRTPHGVTLVDLIEVTDNKIDF